MEVENDVTRSIIDERHSSEGESGATRSIIDELHSWEIQGDQMVDESIFT